MAYQAIEFNITDNVAHIVLNRPDDANALDMAMSKDLMQASIECDENPEIRAVLLSGKGRFFCAGGDLASFGRARDNIAAHVKEMTVYLHAALSRFARMDAPMIMAVNGVAAGAGFSIAASGDLVIAAESSKYTMAYTRAGLVPDGSSTYYVARHIGMRRTAELMLTNRMLSADEALEWGLVNRIVADDQLMDEATALARELAAGPTMAYGEVKKLLQETFSGSLETQMEFEARGIARCAASADGLEGVAAFLEKRKPVFSGT